MRSFGDRPRPGRDHVRRPGAYAVLPRDGRLLITRQSGSGEPFQLPGGGIDRGEGPVAALRREVREETGWTIGAPRRLGSFRRFVFMPEYRMWAEKICLIYLARPLRRTGPPADPDHRALWVTPGQAWEILGEGSDRSFSRHALSMAFE